MKDGLENIDEVIKQAFDGFEANVDPSVWNNVQNSINSGVGSTPQVDPSTVTGIAGKSLAVKIVAGVALLGTVATATYFVPDLLKDKVTVVAESTVVEDNISEKESDNEIVLPKINLGEQIEILNEKSSFVVEEIEINNKDNSSVEPNRAERTETVAATENNIENSEAQNGQDNPPSVESNFTTEINNVTPKEETPTKVEELIKLRVTMDVDVVKGKAPLSVQFDAFGNGVRYFWDFSDGSDEVREESPIHIFEEEGTYNVTLTGIDKNGNSKTDYKTIIVEKDYSSSIETLSNIFTPNGDGHNDFYKIRGKNIKTVQVRIMDNRGNVIYVIRSMDGFWDGKDKNGNYVIQGQYYMFVDAVGNDGKKHSFKQGVNVRP